MISVKFAVRLSLGLIFSFSFLNSCALQQTDLGGRLNSAPTIQFDDTVYDFKFVGPEQEIVHIFKLKNFGSESIVINEISTDCGCTAAMVSEKIISPNGEGKIHVRFQTPRFEGLQEKHVLIATNPPASEKIVLTVKGMVKIGAAVFPQGFNFGKIKAGETKKKCIRLYQLSKEKLELIEIQSDPFRFDVTSAPFTDTNHQGFDICLELKPGAEHGMINDVITLHTNLTAKPRIDVMVLALVE